jgi:hypothetical protein
MPTIPCLRCLLISKFAMRDAVESKLLGAGSGLTGVRSLSRMNLCPLALQRIPRRTERVYLAVSMFDRV